MHKWKGDEAVAVLRVISIVSAAGAVRFVAALRLAERGGGQPGMQPD